MKMKINVNVVKIGGKVVNNTHPIPISVDVYGYIYKARVNFQDIYFETLTVYLDASLIVNYGDF